MTLPARGAPSDPASPLRVAVVAPPFYEIPPRSYGGTELVCYLLVEGLVYRGHEVTLIAAGPGHTRARFVQTMREPGQEGAAGESGVDVLHAARAAAAITAIEVDIVHDHSRAGPLVAPAHGVPTVVTVHAPVAGRDSQAEIFDALGRWVSLIAISEAQRRSAPHLNWTATVPNGIPVDEYPFGGEPSGYLLCLGRISPHKGVHLAIDAARAAGRPLVVAGSWTVPSERVYFEEEVRPRLGPHVEWVGEVAGRRKAELLSGADCLLFPASWEEPFGLAMIEAMACGTPVVALRAGSVPEVVVDGKTGIVCDDPAELPAAIRDVTRLDRSACRRHVSDHFSVAAMVEGYEAAFRQLLMARR